MDEKNANAKQKAPLGLRTVALFEFVKGSLVFLVGLGAFSLIHKNVQLTVEKILHTLHLDPAWHYSRLFLAGAAELTDQRLLYVGCGAMVYTLIRFVEAYGLWHERAWAEWFAVVSACIYVPVEIYHLWDKGFNLSRITVFVGNIIIVVYLAWLLRAKHQKKQLLARLTPTGTNVPGT